MAVRLSNRTYDLDDLICAAVQGDLELLKRILAKKRHWEWPEIAVKYAAKMSHLHILDALPVSVVWPRCSIAHTRSVQLIICDAAGNGNITVLNWFAKQISISEIIEKTLGEPLSAAAINNEVETLEWFEPHLIKSPTKMITMKSGKKILHVVFAGLQRAMEEMVRNDSVEAYKWFKSHDITFDNFVTYGNFPDTWMIKLIDICAKGSPRMLRELLIHYLGRQADETTIMLKKTFIQRIIQTSNLSSYRILAEQIKMSRAEWVAILLSVDMGGLTLVFGWLWREDYVALRRPDIWKHCAATCVANAIVAQRASTVCKRGLPNELWQNILNLM